MDIQTILSEKLSEIQSHYKHLHAHPELSFEETNTSAYIKSQLEKLDLEVHQLPQNAVLAFLKAPNAEKTIGLRAELDALPLVESTNAPYPSQNRGKMHACGHDLHMTCALGTTMVLSEFKDQLTNNILFIFQHGEEKIPGGAQDVINSAFFKSHKPDLMIALHSFPDLKAGEVGFREGPYMASADEIDIHIKGPGGHAAMPHKTVDTVVTAAHVLVALQQIRSRFIPAETPGVLSFGNVVTNSVMNIIPKEVKLEGTFRIMDETWRKKVHYRVKEIANHTAQSMGAECEVVIRHGYPSIANDESITKNIRNIAENTLGKENVFDLPLRMTADDFGYYAHEIPSTYFRLGVADESGKCAGLHTPEFLPDLKAIETGVKVLSEVLLASKE
ncbi:MAG: amidohydrolase [Salinivirgaceae bacterium]|nr:MAG: amidohydrolase [Salinivirgaceae bacterium]